jgi:hypothetical protein
MVAPEVAGMALVMTAATAISITWLRMHYRSASALQKEDLKRLEARLAQIEHAIDSIAVETERISEGQRFTTKLLSEKSTQETR